MRRIFALMAAVMMVAVFATPTVAKDKEKDYVDPVGPLVKLYYGQVTLSEGEPFHIYHGHGLLEGYDLKDFDLEITLDGKKLKQDYLFTAPPDDPIFSWSKQWLFNFEDGLPAGEYVLHGEWTYPCQAAIDFGFLVEDDFDCRKPDRAWTWTPGLTLNLTVES